MFFKKKDSNQEQINIQAAADKLYSQKKYQKALNEYLKLTKFMPDDLALLNKIGDSYSKINDHKNAFKYFERVANHHAHTGFLPKAIAVYKKILKLDPDHSEARENLVKLYLQKDLTSEAKAELKKITDHYLQSNLMSRALDTLKKLVELEPSNIQYHNQLAEILIKEGRSKEACQQFFEMARSFADKKMVQQAKMVVQKALNLDPDYPDILIISAQLSIEAGKFEKGVSKLQKVLAKNPVNLDALKILGDAYFHRGDFDNAHQCFIKIIQIDNTQTQYLEKLIEALLGDRKLELATNYLETLSDMLILQKKQERAISLVRNILELDETFEPAVNLLVKIYLATNMNSNAILTLEKAANHFLNLNNPSKAEPFIKNILNIDPDNLEWRSQLNRDESSHRDPHVQQQEFVRPPLEENNQMPSGIHEEEDLEEISALVSGDLDASMIEDTSTSIKNRLTEVEIFIRHGLTDKARIHLDKILKKFPDHIDANRQLRQIHLELDKPEKAAKCSMVLAKAYIEKNDFEKALGFLDEAEPYFPGAVRKLKGVLESKEHAEVSLRFDGDSSQAYDPDMSSSGLSISQENLIIEPTQQEVVSMKADSSSFNDFDAPEIMKAPSDDSIWALDIPSVGQKEIDFQEGTLDEDEIVFDFMQDHSGDLEDSSHDDDLLPGNEAMFDESATDPSLFPKHEELSGEFSLDQIQDDDSESEIEIPIVDDEFSEDKIEVPEEDAVLEFEESLSSGDTDNIEDLEEVEIIEEIPAEALETQNSEIQTGSILGEIEEIDFFISMEAYHEAHNLVLEAIEKHGPLPELLHKQQEIPVLNQGPIVANDIPDHKPEAPESDLFDLASVLSDEFFDEEKDVTDNSAPEEFQSVEELFKEFKKGVAEQIADSDFQTHYDLGIGYKEMGLLKEGISEFRIAMRDPSRLLDCATMISICQKELSQTAEAVETLENAINKGNLTESQKNILKYELAITFEGNGDLEKAIEIFQQIEESEPGYRDVRERIEMLV